MPAKYEYNKKYKKIKIKETVKVIIILLWSTNWSFFLQNRYLLGYYSMIDRNIPPTADP